MSKKVHFVLSDFDECELESQNQILVIDDQITNNEIIDGFLMILGFSDRNDNTVFVHDGYQAWLQIQKSIDER